MTLIKLVLLIFLLFFSLPAFCAEDLPQIKSSIKVSGEYLEISYENISDKPIKIGNISFSEPEITGTFFYIYDVDKKKNQSSGAVVDYPPGASREQSPSIYLTPGAQNSIKIKSSAVMDYFIYVPRCYYLTTVYRKIWKGFLIHSRPSVPLLFCKK